jgi:hypothetical protein
MSIITTNCPGCSAPLQVEDNATSAVCQFCGAHFEVNLAGIAPSFRKVGSASEPASDQPAPEQPLPEPSAYTDNPPIPGDAPVSAGEELYNLPIPNASGTGFPPTDTPPPYNAPPAPPQVRLSGARLWIAVGLVVLAAFCMTCLCLSIFAIRTVR